MFSGLRQVSLELLCVVRSIVRLVLADVIWYAQEKFDPKFIVDLATLTGAIIVGLGRR